MAACQICSDLPLGPNPIFQIDKRARLLIVGQAPGRITHAKNRPFDDPSGTRLRDWLGIEKGRFYDDPKIGIFPMALCYPGAGNGGDKPPPLVCAQTWRNPVLDHLTKVDLTLLIGNYAVSWHLPKSAKQTLAHTVKSMPLDGPILALPHPSPRNNRWLRANPWFERDIIPVVRFRVRQALA